MARIGRRAVLQGLSAAVVAPRTARHQPAGDPFPWGVASFDPTADAVLLWTRVDPASTPGEVALRWVVARDQGLSDVAASGSTAAGPATGHCATVDVTDLAPGGTWWFAFETGDGARSPVGRTRTLPDGAAAPLRLGVVSCSRYASGGFAAYAELAARTVDLVVHLGDYVYEDGSAGVREHDPPRELRTLADYRARYAQHRSDPALQALHAAHPMVAVWDDHEVSTNAWREGAAGHDDATDGPWTARLAAATQAHEEWLPGRGRRDGAGRLQAWRSLSIGTLAELVVLDTRTWRDAQPQTPADLAAPTARSMLGPAQEAFVTDRLRSADRPPWILLANQVMYHPLRIPVPTAAMASEVAAAGFLVAEGTAVNPDQWDGYPTAREALNVAMGGQGGIVVLTGDAHSSWGWDGPANDGGRPVMVELVTPSVSTAPFAERLPVPAIGVEAALRALDPALSFVELSSHGYLVVEVDADRVHGEWWFVDPGGAEPERFGGARSSPRAVPMGLVEEVAPRPEPAPSPSTSRPPVTDAADPTGSSGGEPWPAVVGAAGAAAGAAVLGAIALRRRRR